MNARRSLGGRSFRALVENDLDIMPLMNLFVALIPMLLISAVFLNVTVIEMDGPREGETATAPDDAPLDLAVTIADGHYVVAGRRLQQAVIDRTGADPAAALGQALAAVVAAHPDNRDVMIVSSATTRYDDIIAVMDITRAAGLPSVSLLGAETNGGAN